MPVIRKTKTKTAVAIALVTVSIAGIVAGFTILVKRNPAKFGTILNFAKNKLGAKQNIGTGTVNNQQKNSVPVNVSCAEFKNTAFSPTTGQGYTWNGKTAGQMNPDGSPIWEGFDSYRLELSNPIPLNFQVGQPVDFTTQITLSAPRNISGFKCSGGWEGLVAKSEVVSNDTINCHIKGTPTKPGVGLINILFGIKRVDGGYSPGYDPGVREVWFATKECSPGCWQNDKSQCVPKPYAKSEPEGIVDLDEYPWREIFGAKPDKSVLPAYMSRRTILGISGTAIPLAGYVPPSDFKRDKVYDIIKVGEDRYFKFTVKEKGDVRGFFSVGAACGHGTTAISYNCPYYPLDVVVKKDEVPGTDSDKAILEDNFYANINTPNSTTGGVEKKDNGWYLANSTSTVTKLSLGNLEPGVYYAWVRFPQRTAERLKQFMIKQISDGIPDLEKEIAQMKTELADLESWTIERLGNEIAAKQADYDACVQQSGIFNCTPQWTALRKLKNILKDKVGGNDTSFISNVTIPHLQGDYNDCMARPASVAAGYCQKILDNINETKNILASKQNGGDSHENALRGNIAEEEKNLERVRNDLAQWQSRTITENQYNVEADKYYYDKN